MERTQTVDDVVRRWQTLRAQGQTATVEELCAGRPEDATEVKESLRAVASMMAFLGLLREDAPPTPSDPGDAQQQTEGPGSSIGPYKLLQKIGEGGMGVVYLAEQERPVHRRVALKVIKPGMDTDQVVARFEVERQALVMMDHLNIARVLDAGSTRTGRPYFVMELVKGVPITEYCDHHHLTPQERLRLFTLVCQALQHAHQKGIIHRDIKPSNVLVTLQDGRPVPKVIDFGVAKAINQKLTEKTLFTRVGTAVGTLEYMSPEQAETSELDVDTRGDIYSLGVLLYEMLTGTTPLRRETLRAAGYAEVVRRIKEEDPPKPSTRLSASGDVLATIAAQRSTPPEKLRRLIRGDLDWIVMKALEKDRTRRYETADAFARDVQRHLNDEPVEACPPSAWYRVRKLARKHKVLIATGSGFAVVLLAGAAISAWMAVRATAAEARARAQRDAAVAARRQSEAVVYFLQHELLAAAPGKRAINKDITYDELLGRASTWIDGEGFVGSPPMEASIRQAIGLSYFMLGNYPPARRHLERSLELRSRNLGDSHPDTLEAMDDVAQLEVAEGHYAEAERLFRRALGSKPETTRDGGPVVFTLLHHRAELAMLLARFGEAGRLFAQALEGRRRLLGPNDQDTLATRRGQAILLNHQSRYREADVLFVEVLEAQRRTLHNDHHDTLTTMVNLSMCRVWLGRYAEAAELALQALEGRRKALGADHPDTIGAVTNLAWVYESWGRHDQAESYAREGLEARRRVQGDENPDTLNAMTTLGTIYRMQGRYPEAEKLLEKSLMIQTRVLTPEHPDTLTTLHNLGWLYAYQGRDDKAEPLFLRVLETRRKVSREEHRMTIMALYHYGIFCYSRKRYVEAEGLFNDALKVGLPALGERNQDMLIVRNYLGALYLDANRLPEAEQTLVRVLTLVLESGANNPETNLARMRLAEVYRLQGDDAKAEAQLRAVLASVEANGSDDPSVLKIRSEVGLSFLKQKNFKAAEPLLVDAYERLDARRKQLSENDKALLPGFAQRVVWLYKEWGKPQEALRWQDRVKAEESARATKP